MVLSRSTILCVLLAFTLFNQSLAQTKPSEEEVAKTVAACSESSGYSPEQLEAATKAKEELPEEGLCFLKCIAESMKVIENGKINDAVFEAMKSNGHVSDNCDVAGATIETCQDMKQFTECFANKPQ